MLKIPTLFTAISLLIATQSFAQKITGKVLLADGKPAEYATILLLHAKDSLLEKGVLCGEDGTFELNNVPNNQYFLTATYVGFDKYMSNVFEFSGNELKMESIVLRIPTGSLEEVQIVAKKPFFEQRIDRMVINVGTSSVNAGGTALQVLQRSPGVMVNKQSNSLQMSGKNGVIIMINGKISRMPPDAIISMLDGMNANNIERIELIHTPPANFDAEGNAGIINIVLKQSTDEGLNGNYSINGGYGKAEKYGASVSFNYRKKKVNFFGNYDYKFNHNPQNYINYRSINQGNDFVETDGKSKRSPDLTNQNARLGADFQINSKTVIGVVGTFFDRNWDMTAVNNIYYLKNKVVENHLKMETKEINHWRSLTGNANFSHEFGKDHSLTMDLDYVSYFINNPSNYVNNYLNGDGTIKNITNIDISKKNPITITVAKADYSRFLNKKIKLETGVKMAMSRFDNDVQVMDNFSGVTEINKDLTSRFKLREDVAAGYATFSYTIDKKTEVKAGLRYEYTDTNLGSVEQPNVVDRQYGRFFPTLYFARTINENKNINLSFSRRINRPGFTQLAPYLIYYDPTTLQGGNPALQPSFVNAVRCGYRYKIFQLTAEYNLETNSLRDFPFVDNVNNTQFSRPVNAGKTHTAYTELSFSYEVKKYWQMQHYMFLAYQNQQFKYADVDFVIPTRFTGFNTTQSFTFSKKLSMDISGNLMTGANWGIYRFRPMGQMGIGFQQKLGEKWGTISFNVNDIFQTGYWSSTAKQAAVNLFVKTTYNEAERTFMLTWNNKFGNKKLKDARQHNRGAEDELRRL